MIYELKKDEYFRVKDFFKQKEVSRAHWVIYRNINGRIFVDNKESPATVVVQFMDSYYVDGDYENEIFIQDWYNIFHTEIAPFEQNKGKNVAFFIFSDEDKSRKFYRKFNISITYKRNFYELEELKYNWRLKLPNNLKVRKIDKYLLSSGAYTNL